MKVFKKQELENKFLFFRTIQLAAIITFQVILPPLFIAKLGLTGYGEWLILVSFVAGFNFLDFGFFNSVVNKVIEIHSTNSLDNSHRLLEKMWKFVFLLAISVLATSATVWFFEFKNHRNSLLVLFLIIATIFQVIIRMNEAISRARLKANGFGILTFSYIVESVGSGLVILSGLGLLQISLLLVISRLIFAITGTLVNRNDFSIHYALRIRFIDVVTFFRHNVKKGVYFLGIPIGNLLLFDGSNIILGLLVSKNLVAEINLLRISTGVIRQVSSAVLSSYGPALSQAIFLADRNKFDLLRKKMKKTLFVSVSICSFGLMMGSQVLLKFFFAGSDAITLFIFMIFLISVLVDIPWNFRSTFLFAANEYIEISNRFLLTSILALISLVPLVNIFGIVGVAIAFSIQDVILTRFSRKKLDNIICTYMPIPLRFKHE